MENNIKIAIADENKEVQELLFKSIKKYDDIEIAQVSNDGQSCIDDLKESKPDILIMDILLPKVDGFELLDYVKNEEIHNDLIIIVMTALTSDRIIKKIIEYDVEYVYNKPFDNEDLITTARISYRTKLTEKAILLKNQISHDKTYGIISDLLISLGIRPNLVGFNYLKTAIFKAYKEIELLGAVTKELYPLVAKIYQTEAANVERSMRHAIEVAWQNEESIKRAIKVYGYTSKIMQRPANSKLISVISNYLRTEDLRKDSTTSFKPN